MQYTVGTQYTVGVSAKKVNSHRGLSKYGWWGLLPLVQKGQTHAVEYAVCSRYAVHSRCWCKKVNSHSARSKYWWWGLLPLVQKGQSHAVPGRCWCKKVNSHSVLSKYGWGTITFSAKRSNPTQLGMQYTVGVGAKRSTHTVYLANLILVKVFRKCF